MMIGLLHTNKYSGLLAYMFHSAKTKARPKSALGILFTYPSVRVWV